MISSQKKVLKYDKKKENLIQFKLLPTSFNIIIQMEHIFTIFFHFFIISL
jgi:hypothetical protein